LTVEGVAVADRVDSILREWGRRRPDLDTSGLEVVARVLRAAHHLQGALDDIAASYGLSHQGDLDVLTEIYRTSPERELTPTELAGALLLTAGGMTVRLNRLQGAGLIVRTPNPSDGRGVFVRLTPVGTEIADHALTTLLDAEITSIQSLDESERAQLAGLLRKVLEGLGDVPAFRPPISVARDEP
jgi:DNA-binding MarR family transcriptional regulator